MIIIFIGKEEYLDMEDDIIEFFIFIFVSLFLFEVMFFFFVDYFVFIWDVDWL